MSSLMKSSITSAFSCANRLSNKKLSSVILKLPTELCMDFFEIATTPLCHNSYLASLVDAKLIRILFNQKRERIKSAIQRKTFLFTLRMLKTLECFSLLPRIQARIIHVLFFEASILDSFLSAKAVLRLCESLILLNAIHQLLQIHLATHSTQFR